MIVRAQNLDQHNALCAFIRHYAYVQQTPDMECIGWVEDGKLVMVAAINGFIGRLCQIHIAMAEGFHFTPKAMLREVFDNAFNARGRAKLLGIVNSNNAKAMRYDLHLGFKEEHRLPGMHSDGGDLVILSMSKEDCRYLNRPDKTKAA